MKNIQKTNMLLFVCLFVCLFVFFWGGGGDLKLRGGNF